MLLSLQSKVGIGVESTPNEYVTPSIWLPFSTLSTREQNTVASLAIDLMPSDMMMPISRIGSVNLQHFATTDSLNAELGAMFGNSSTSNGKTTHTVSLFPPTMSITEYDGEYARGYVGGVLSDYTITWQDSGVLTCQSKWSSQVSQTEVATAAYGGMPAYAPGSDVSVPVVEPSLGWQGVISINGTTMGLITGGQWTFQRTFAKLGTDLHLDVMRQYTTGFKASATLTMAVDDDVAFDSLRQTTNGTIATTFGAVSVQASKATWTTLGWDRSSGVLKETLKVECSFNATDQGPCTITVG